MCGIWRSDFCVDEDWNLLECFITLAGIYRYFAGSLLLQMLVTISNDCGAFTLKDQAIWKDWRHHDPLKHEEPFAQQQCFTSQKTWSLSSMTVRTSDLASPLLLNLYPKLLGCCLLIYILNIRMIQDKLHLRIRTQNQLLILICADFTQTFCHQLLGPEPALGISENIARGVIRGSVSRKHKYWLSICAQRQVKGFPKRLSASKSLGVTQHEQKPSKNNDETTNRAVV
jgi:hypothetical protein